MEDLGEQVPDHAVDMIFTDPPYIDELWEDAYRNLADLAARVLKPYGFLITYAPQAHLDEIIFILNHAGDRWVHGQLNYFWIIQSINKGPAAKAHKWNALCKHKPILVYQLIPDQGKIKAARRCFSDTVNGYRQKRFHPWQQSVHDVLGIIDRFMVPGEILLDPFAGWGTSLIAANLLGMEWVGFEIDPDRQRIATERLQQQPIALDAFGIEAEAAECEREPAPEQKDTSKQASIEICKVVKAKRPKGLVANGPLAPCLSCEAVARCLRHDPHAGCLREFLDFEKGIEEAKEAPAEEFVTVCPNVKSCRECPVKSVCGVPFDRDCIFCAVKLNCKHYGKPANNCLRKDPAPQPYVQHCCGTCGHHKGRKTFHDSCPRLGELLFKGGTKSAKVLMDETAATECEHWTDIPGYLYAGKKPEEQVTTV
jgi:hypothetical protein